MLGVSELSEYGEQRLAMVREQLEARGVIDRRVLGAMAALPRHVFVPPALAGQAYKDRPLPIGFGQTISQPFMVARASELGETRPEDRALEVGAGCGYQAAVLSRLCRFVYAVELVPELAERARAALARVGCTNVEVGCFDASGGWPEHAPYDLIVVSAAAPRVPPLLAAQLADGGRLVVPVGDEKEQALVQVRREGDGYVTREDTRCRYVNLQGRYGFGREPPLA